MNKDLLKYSFSNIWNRKSRSFLTILSIVIGITAIVALSSFGLGIRSFVQDYAKKAGIDKLMMMPKDYVSSVGESKSAFTEDELNFVKGIKGVDEATGIILSNAKVKFKDYKEKYTYASGMPTDASEMRLAGEAFSIMEIEKGRDLKKGDVLKAVLGYNYLIPNRLFKKPISAGDKIKINDIDVEVVGFYKEIGSPQDDAQIYLSQEGAKEIFKKEDYEYIVLRSAADQNPTELADKIKERFRKYREQKEGEEDFFVQTFEQAMETYGAILDVLIGILVLISLISVVVAAVNIVNTMYTTVLERTREIGVMKAIGSRNEDIRTVFIIESGILGFAGGVFGIILGYGIAKLGGYIAKQYGLSMLQPYFPWWLIVGCLLFAFLVGAFSGTLPAIRASRLNPVDALRYE